MEIVIPLCIAACVVGGVFSFVYVTIRILKD